MTIFDQSAELQTAWQPKKMFNDIMKLSDHEESKRRFKEWIESVESLEISEFADCVKAYRRWFRGIVESFRVPYSNGFTEEKKQQAKSIKTKRIRMKETLTTTESAYYPPFKSGISAKKR